MGKKVFSAEQFKATQWDTAEDKARFANHFVRFVGADFKETLFPQWFYKRLFMCRGHIAHYNSAGFYSEQFSTTERRLEFLAHWAEYPVYGDPAWTYSDVESALREWIRESGLVEAYTDKAQAETRKAELTELKRLQEKYPDVQY